MSVSELFHLFVASHIVTGATGLLAFWVPGVCAASPRATEKGAMAADRERVWGMRSGFRDRVSGFNWAGA